MTKKAGRNDPCPCGSGKKHKQCCLLQAEEPKKLYTSDGKRKFKARVLESGGAMLSSTGSTIEQGALRFLQADYDYRVSNPTPLPPVSSKSLVQPKTSEPTASPNADFHPTSEDFRLE